MKYYPLILLFFYSFLSHGQVNSANIKIDSITTLQLVREKFNPKINKLDIKNGFVLGINDCPLFGSDGEIPKDRLIKATLKDGKRVEPAIYPHEEILKMELEKLFK